MEHWTEGLNKGFILNGLGAMPGGIFVYRADGSAGEIIYANQALLDLFECESVDEFMEHTGGTFQGLVYPDDYDAIEASIAEQIAASDDLYDQVHYRIVTRSGKIRHIEDHGRLVIDPVEGPLYYVFVTTARSKIDSLTGLMHRWRFLQLARRGALEIYERGDSAVIIAFDFTGMNDFYGKYGMDEGDSLLASFAALLRKYFTAKRCSRFAEDVFYVYAVGDDIEATLDRLIVALHKINNGKTLPVKIGIAEFSPDESISAICDKAKLASRMLTSAFDSEYVRFTADMAQKLAEKEYILGNLNQAIAAGWIEPYFQPVVRTLSGKLCSTEALARWIDPVRGMISPGVFIPILEEYGLSYKVDIYIVNRVVLALHRRISAGLPVVPVSVNISRSDFEYCDPVALIAEACDTYAIKRSLICVEITESTLMKDKEQIKEAIDRFHAAGFAVWMDDFGSGYSSLNMLKDFDFDEIKIDMGFLRDFNERSKTVVTMAVRMAKKLGIHTLAEGVETEEHLNFLRSIGCERIQGYYYGRPQPLNEMMANLEERGIGFESSADAALYETTGMCNLVSERALGLVFYANDEFESIFCSSRYNAGLDNNLLAAEEKILTNINNRSATISSKMRALANKAIASGEEEIVTYVMDDQYVRISLKPVASNARGTMLIGYIDRSAFEGEQRSRRLDDALRNLISSYDGVYLVDYGADTRTVLSTSLPDEREGDVIKGLNDYYVDYTKQRIHNDDRRVIQYFLTPSYIENRFLRYAEDRAGFVELLRIKQPDGNYRWTEFQMVALADELGTRLLVGVKPLPIDNKETGLIKRILKTLIVTNDDRSVPDDEWVRGLLRDSTIKLFWKDEDRRFVGASKAFLDYYGFESVDEIVGKTDEDMAWHVNDVPFQNDEIAVLEKGVTVSHAPGKNIVSGLLRDIVATKFPIYHNGKIVGLMGYFLDVEQDIKENLALTHGTMLDPLTGLLNVHGMEAATHELEDNLRTNGDDYGYVVISIAGYDSFRDIYGKEISTKLLKKVAGIIRADFKTALLARGVGCQFMLAVRGALLNTITSRLQSCVQQINAIKDIEKRSCTLYASFGLARGSEASTQQQMIDLARSRQKDKVKNSALVSSRDFTPDPYSELPVSYFIMQPIMSTDGNSATDMRFLFVNQKYCEHTGMSRGTLVGHGYLELFPRTDPAFIEQMYRSACGKYTHGTVYDGATHSMVRFTAAPSVMHGACTVVCENTEG